MDIKSLFSNWVVRNLLLALAFVLALMLVVNLVLGVITRHGKEVAVPDFTNMTLSEARYAAGRKGIRVEVGDSVYVRRMKKGAVFTQLPKPGAMVKNGRRILLTINAVEAKKVSVPDLVGLSMRQAKAELISRGLALGRLIYVSDMATNNVLRQLYENQQIPAGRQVESGSRIDLVVGLNSEDGRTFAPDVRGMKYLRAVDAVQDNSLNLGRLSFDSEIKTYSDSLNAVVYEQRPASAGIPLTMGAEVSLRLTLDPAKIPADVR